MERSFPGTQRAFRADAGSALLIAAVFACKLDGRLIISFEGVPAFSIIVVIMSALITQLRDKMDGSEIAAYLVIIA